MADTESEIPKNQSAMERGLLDLSVTLSTRNITAGKQFAIFVLAKNPFDKPVWVRQVHVSLPVELNPNNAEEGEQRKRNEKDNNKNEKDNNKNNLQQEKDAQIVRLETKLNVLNSEFHKILENINNKESIEDHTLLFLRSVESKIEEVKFELQKLIGGSQANIRLGDRVKMGKLKIFSNQQNRGNHGQSKIRIGDDSSMGDFKIISDQHDVRFGDEVMIGSVEIYGSSFLSAQARKIDLESSLPDNVALQPGSTVVYTAILYVKKNILFTPSQYRLQFNVNYCFHSKPQDRVDEQSEIVEEGIFTNTVAYELSIRPSVDSVIIGAVLGGFTGAIARLLQITPTEKWQTFSIPDIIPSIGSAIAPVTLAIILSGIAVVFMSRKSEAQSFVSVEDFWGGLLIGFLVGYTGTSFFEKLTGITNPTPNIPNPSISPKP